MNLYLHVYRKRDRERERETSNILDPIWKHTHKRFTRPHPTSLDVRPPTERARGGWGSGGGAAGGEVKSIMGICPYWE